MSWTEKYRPTTLDDCILPNRILLHLKDCVKKNELPNCLFTGSAGLGKTSAAQSLINDMNLDSIKINGSMSGNIDTLRNEILQFASTNSFTGNKKCVILDEADYLNPNSTQPALRNFMEEYSKNVSFILTCNYPTKIIEPLKSRSAVFNFNLSNADKKEIIPKIYAKLISILEAENITYNPEVVQEIMKKYLGDWRKTINELQKFSAFGTLEGGIYLLDIDKDFDRLLPILKEKNFRKMIDWVSENYDLDFTEFCGKFYKMVVAKDFADKQSIPDVVILINEYSYKSAFVLDKQIHMSAFLTEIMRTVKF